MTQRTGAWDLYGTWRMGFGAYGREASDIDDWVGVMGHGAWWVWDKEHESG